MGKVYLVIFSIVEDLHGSVDHVEATPVDPHSIVIVQNHHSISFGGIFLHLLMGLVVFGINMDYKLRSRLIHRLDQPNGGSGTVVGQNAIANFDIKG